MKFYRIKNWFKESDNIFITILREITKPFCIILISLFVIWSSYTLGRLIAINECTKNDYIPTFFSEGIETVNYEGHTYIVNSHGGIIHSESCECKK